MRKRRWGSDQVLFQRELAKAAANGAALLNSIADAFGSINERLSALEARMDAFDGNKSNKGKPNHINNLKTELIDLPGHLMPRWGVETGWPWPGGSKIRYTQPLMTKQAKPK